jgi:hypothetical protein
MRVLGPAVVLGTMALLGGALGGSVTGCADIWGFQDAVDLRDGGGADAAETACNCVASSPEGWTGPLEIFEGSGGSDAPACGSTYGTDAYDGTATPSAPPATCSCSCGPADGACTPPAVLLFKDGSCTQSCGPSRQELGAGCTSLDVGSCNGGAHFTVASPTAMPGARCVPSLAQTLPPVTWANRARLCAPASAPPVATCAAGQICAAATEPAFEAATYCVLRLGESPCPPGYPHGRTYYGSVAEGRTCSPCSCGVPAGGTCGNATVSLSMGPGCSGGSTVSAPSDCEPLSGMSVASFSGGMEASGGACPSAGGQPGGSVTPATPTTICCTP